MRFGLSEPHTFEHTTFGFTSAHLTRETLKCWTSAGVCVLLTQLVWDWMKSTLTWFAWLHSTRRWSTSLSATRHSRCNCRGHRSWCPVFKCEEQRISCGRSFGRSIDRSSTYLPFCTLNYYFHLSFRQTFFISYAVFLEKCRTFSLEGWWWSSWFRFRAGTLNRLSSAT